MNPEPGEYRDFPEPNIVVNDELAHPFDSPNHAQTINRPLNDLPEIEDSRFYSDIPIDNSISAENQSADLTAVKSSKLNEQFDDFQEISSDQEDQFLTKTKQMNFDEKFRYLQKEFENTQKITTLFQNQLIDVKNLRDKLSFFCSECRSEIVSTLNIQQNTENLTESQFEMLTSYAPESMFVSSIVAKRLLNQKSNENLANDYEIRVNYARSIMKIYRATKKLQIRLSALNDLLVKSVLSKNERFHEIEQFTLLPKKFFESVDDVYQYETTKEKVFIRCIDKQIKENEVEIFCIDHWKHPLAQISYNLSEKYSFIFDIHFKRVITSYDQLTIAIPCFSLSSTSNHRQMFIRLKRSMDPLIHIPARVELYNEIPYAIFRLTHSLSDISVEAIFYYPFEILKESQNGSNCDYTCDHSSVFRIVTPKNYFIRSPRVRFIPLNHDLIQCIHSLKNEDQLLSSSDLIEIQWFKENKIEGFVTITLQLTRHFNRVNQANEDLRKRRRKGQRKILFQRQKFEQDKYDETGSTLSITPTPTNLSTPLNVISHLPTLSSILERTQNDQSEEITRKKLNFNRENNSHTIFKWKLDSFQIQNAPIILLGYKNRKWKNCNHLVKISTTDDKDTFVIHSAILFDRMILIRCWPESTSEGKFDKLAENLWSMSSMKLFSCVLARDPTSLTRYGLVIIPIEKQHLAEDLLRQRNYTEWIFNEQSIEENVSQTRIHQYQSQHTLSFNESVKSISKYVQFCLQEGTYVTIFPTGNIDLHEKVELNLRLHAQYPILLEFDIYPIDIYRQKTDEDFIGTLDIYEINEHATALKSSSSTLAAAAAAVSSRTSSGFEISENLPENASPRPSTTGRETLSDNRSVTFERLTLRDLKETSLICKISIRLPKHAFRSPSTQLNTIPIEIPQFFHEVIQSLTEGKQEFAQALNIHPSLINSLLTTSIPSQQRTQSNTSLRGQSRTNLFLESLPKSTIESEALIKWFKRQNAFQLTEILEKIISALIQIGRIDLAYTFKITNLKNKCS
ncbi:unnamed protein product [Adineta ricciae]|uniref:Uncharacterized protein n=1 Tax=Adineta ricciae TaxID=249248 RepID=A0A815GDC8_ADIRI|nr:unnamed protein product [Adineta ricciae]CAF1337109.1 unnamed protein product [Adineta ricciae]